MVSIEDKYHRLKIQLKMALKEGKMMQYDLERTHRAILILQIQKEKILEQIVSLEGYWAHDISMPRSSLGRLFDDLSEHKYQYGYMRGGDVEKHKRMLSSDSEEGLENLNIRGNSGTGFKNGRAQKNTLMERIVKVKRGSLQGIQRDENNKPILPFRAGVFNVISLGRVIYDNDEYHCERHIYPVGYTVRRPYHSMVDVDKIVTYTCSIKEGKDKPLFHVVAEDCPEKVIQSSTATGAWIPVITAVSKLKKKDKSSSTSGPENFGLSNPKISVLIQELDGVEKCKNYVRKNFVEENAPIQRKRTFTKKV